MIPSLLNRSYYSFLNSSLSIKDIIEYSVRNNYRHVVISDFLNAHGWIEFYKESKASNLVPVFGLQINQEFSSLLLLAKNLEGYKNLLIISSEKSIREELLEGIIVILLEGETIFENHGDFYIANSEAENGVYVRENKFLNEEDYEFFCVLRAIANNSSVQEEKDLNFQFINDYLNFNPHLDPDSYQVKNIFKILESCEEYDIFDSDDKLDFFSNPDEEICRLVSEKLSQKSFPSPEEKHKYRERLKSELKTIVSKKFSAYFLIVQDAVSWCKSNEILVGPGRGSSCGSLLAYMLNITEIDPLQYGLYFERFLNPERSALPDIDIDVANNKRDLLLEYLRKKYGDDHVAQISTFQTFKSKNSVREVSKAYGLSKTDIDRCSSALGSFNESNFDDESKLPTAIKNLFNDFPSIERSVKKIVDFPKAPSVHPAGVLISSKPLSSFLPLIKTIPLNVSQWEYEALKNFGLVKFDFLALQYLSSLHKIQKSVEDKLQKKISWIKVNRNDARVYETIISGKNAFIFQFESHKIHALIRRFTPKNLLDLALISALHRPGASIIVARKASGTSVKLLPPPFSKFVSDTFGFLVYQEQLMQIVAEVTGGTMGFADIFRREIEIPEKEPLCRKLFFEEGKKRFSEDTLEKCYSYVLKFATYGFNKSHALAYAEISYRLLWFKTYFSEHFYAELLDFSTSPEHFNEIQESGFSIEKPCYGYSLYEKFNLVNKTFYFPLSKVSSLSLSFEENFKRMEGFEEKTTIDAIKSFLRAKVFKEDLRILIRVGYFNCLFKDGETEYYWESNLDEIVSSYIHNDEAHLNSVENSLQTDQQYKNYKQEYLSVNLYRNKIQPLFFKNHPSIHPISALSLSSYSNQKYLGFISYLKGYKSFNDVPFLKIKISDGFYSSSDIVLFNADNESLQEALDKGYAVLIRIQKSEDFLKGTVEQIFKRDG